MRQSLVLVFPIHAIDEKNLTFDSFSRVHIQNIPSTEVSLRVGLIVLPQKDLRSRDNVNDPRRVVFDLRSRCLS